MLQARHRKEAQRAHPVNGQRQEAAEGPRVAHPAPLERVEGEHPRRRGAHSDAR